jgi:hypothetical protein
VIAAMSAAIIGATVSAHRLDEYLQAARLAVEPDRVGLELDLTPGMAVANEIIAEIDRDRDGSLSPQEQIAYAAKVLSAIDLEVDGRPLQLQPAMPTFPDLDAVRRGEGTIRLRSRAFLPSQSEGAHQLFFRNGYRPEVSVYLANAVVPPSDRVAVDTQRRNRDQRELTIDYAVRTGSPAHTGAWLLISLAVVSTTAKLLTRRSRAA